MIQINMLVVELTQTLVKDMSMHITILEFSF